MKVAEDGNWIRWLWREKKGGAVAGGGEIDEQGRI